MFYVKRYYFLPDNVEILYITMKHVNRKGVVVYDNSMRDKTSYAKHILEEIRDFVWSLNLAGFPLLKFTVFIWRPSSSYGMPGNLVKSRDCFLSKDDIRNICSLL